MSNEIAISGKFDKSQGINLNKLHEQVNFVLKTYFIYSIKANLVENTKVQPNYTQDLMVLAQQIQDVCLFI